MRQYIYGIRAILEAIESGTQIEKILLKKHSKSNIFYKLRQIAKKYQIPVQYVPIEKLNKITRQNHQGAIAYISPISFWNIDELISNIFDKGQIPIFLILDRITDVHNFGAIVRTAECSGISGIIVPRKNTALISSDAMKTSAGALNYVPIVKMILSEAVDKLHQAGFQIIAATEKAKQNFYEIDFTVPSAIIMGSEEKGISFELLKKSDFHAKIPIIGKIESLNVSVASALFMYEALRQRLFVKK